MQSECRLMKAPKAHSNAYGSNDGEWCRRRRTQLSDESFESRVQFNDHTRKDSTEYVRTRRYIGLLFQVYLQLWATMIAAAPLSIHVQTVQRTLGIHALWASIWKNPIIIEFPFHLFLYRLAWPLLALLPVIVGESLIYEVRGTPAQWRLSLQWSDTTDRIRVYLFGLFPRPPITTFKLQVKCSIPRSRAITSAIFFLQN